MCCIYIFTYAKKGEYRRDCLFDDFAGFCAFGSSIRRIYECSETAIDALVLFPCLTLENPRNRLKILPRLSLESYKFCHYFDCDSCFARIGYESARIYKYFVIARRFNESPKQSTNKTFSSLLKRSEVSILMNHKSLANHLL